MNIYIAHSTRDFDFQNELYLPLLNSKLATEHHLKFPHQGSASPIQSKDQFKQGLVNIVVAEVSHSSTGMGIELGWANAYDVPIIALHKKGARVSDSVKILANKIAEYDSVEDLAAVVESLIEKEVE